MKAENVGRVLDAATVMLGVLCASGGVAAYDWRAGLIVLGSLLLGLEAVALARR